MPLLSPIADVVVDPSTSLSKVLPQTTDDDGTVTYAASGLAEWMTFTPSTRILSGTAPNASSTTAVTYTATDSNGVISTETFDIVVRLGLGDFNTSNLEVEALALIQAGPRDVATVWARAPRTARGRLLSGEFDLNNNSIRYQRVAFFPAGRKFAWWRTAHSQRRRWPSFKKLFWRKQPRRRPYLTHPDR